MDCSRQDQCFSNFFPRTSVFQTFSLARPLQHKWYLRVRHGAEMLLTYSFEFYNLTFLQLQLIYNTLMGLWVRIPPGAWMPVLVSVVCCQVEVSASGWSLVQRSLTECGVSGCDREASIMWRPWPTGGCCAIVKKKYYWNVKVNNESSK